MLTMPSSDIGRSCEEDCAEFVDADGAVEELALDGAMLAPVSVEDPPPCMTCEARLPMPEGEKMRPMPCTEPTIVSPKDVAASPVAARRLERTSTACGPTPRNPRKPSTGSAMGPSTEVV